MGQTKICRYCGNIVYSDAQTCEFCGKYLLKKHDNPDLYCAKCKAPVNTDDNYCQNCGAVFCIPENNTNIKEEPAKGNLIGIPYNIGILFTSFAASFAITVFLTAGKETSFGQNSIYFCIAFIVAEIFFYIYFLPSIIAIEKNHPNIYPIYFCNLILGITIIGWFVTLFFALQSKQKEIN